MTTSFIEGVLTGSIQSSTSVLYAALGEVVVERAGVINLGVEGTMLMGAVTGFMVTAQTGSALLGVVAGGLAAGVFNLILAYLVVTRKANQLASGLALMFFGLGLSALIGKPYVGQLVHGLDALPIPFLADLPVIGRILFNHDILIYLMAPLAALVWWVLFRTKWGLSLRAVGENKVVAFAAGLKPELLQYQAVFIGGVLAGLGGAHLSLAFAQSWSEGMTSGRGFIAVALVIFAAWHPLRAVAAALLFGGALALQLQLQARGANISPFLLDMIPYLLTLGVLLFVQKGRKRAMPEGLKAVFEGTN
ncbi:MAG: ABC transporter permease [Anaerolineae bacterium]|nr:ABC transporter permease [Anaerolineales bacterium]MCQ3972800.1 ABC transporter permease [Anaerolineae bacterium]